MFKWTKVGTPIVVMRGRYKQFLAVEFRDDMHNHDITRRIKNVY